MKESYRTVKPFSEMSLEQVIDEMDYPYKNEDYDVQDSYWEHNYLRGFCDGALNRRKDANSVLGF